MSSIFNSITTTGTIRSGLQSYGILPTTTNQVIPSGTLTELTTYYTGGSNIVSGVISNPSSGRLQVSTAGVYSVTASVEFNTANNGASSYGGTASASIGERTLLFRISGGATYYGASRSVRVPVDAVYTCTNSTLLSLTSGQYVSVWVSQSSGTSVSLNLVLDFANSFTMCRVL